MTTLRKKVSRVTVDPFYAFGPDRDRLWVATLAPGDLLTLRAKGRRRGEVSARLVDIHRMILIGRSNAQRMEKLRAKKAKKASARELRRLVRGIHA
jgi:hypothetical protein